MRYSEILNELFSSETIPFEWETQTNKYWRGIFTVNGLDYGLSCQLYDGYMDDDNNSVPVWEIGFSLDENGLNDRVIDTGGAQFKIFNTVISHTVEFIKRVHPDCFQISADANQPNRVKLYSTFVRRFAKVAEANGYVEIPQLNHEYFKGFVPNSKQWVFRKK